MHPVYQGGYVLLATTPVWQIFAVLIFFTLNILFIGRQILEGFEYNISWSSQQGDFALTIFICLGASILQSGVVVFDSVSAWIFFSEWVGVSLLTVMFCLYLGGFKKDTMMDAYHNVVIVPLFIWLLLLTLPVVYQYGSLSQKLGGTACFAVWGVCFIFDLLTGRLKQRPYLEKIGVRPRSPKWGRKV